MCIILNITRRMFKRNRQNPTLLRYLLLRSRFIISKVSNVGFTGLSDDDSLLFNKSSTFSTLLVFLFIFVFVLDSGMSRFFQWFKCVLHLHLSGLHKEDQICLRQNLLNDMMIQCSTWVSLKSAPTLQCHIFKNINFDVFKFSMVISHGLKLVY